MVNAEPLVWRENMTIRDVLAAKKYVFPMLIVTLNGARVERDDYETMLVPDEAELKVLHLLSGG